MGVVDALPDTPVEHQTVTSLSSHDAITDCLPVLSIETAGHMLSDLVLALCLVTDEQRLLLAFDGSGWQRLDTTTHTDGFDIDDDDIVAWFGDKETYEWLTRHGINPDATPLSGYETNKDTAPDFLKPN
ncbi:hypothetical protein [Salinibaculum rarum]|uniref:hypothetical protein n=1 Tax=Salinibaculum rarum TaxID=3058903 RepID=UPI00265E260C|nr:hypothetical protein [Salinibaculum sp. KK48]